MVGVGGRDRGGGRWGNSSCKLHGRVLRGRLGERDMVEGLREMLEGGMVGVRCWGRGSEEGGRRRRWGQRKECRLHDTTDGGGVRGHYRRRGESNRFGGDWSVLNTKNFLLLRCVRRLVPGVVLLMTLRR